MNCVQIHLGTGVWLFQYLYNEACNNNSVALFVKTLCDILIEPHELSTSTITGKVSNREPTHGEDNALNKLDSTRVLAIKGIHVDLQYKMNQKKMYHVIISDL